jgi:20S proteasome alpha/beta subunit
MFVCKFLFNSSKSSQHLAHSILALLLLLLCLLLHSLQSPYHCNLLVAGFDEGVGASLYWLDYLATLHKVNTGGTGYGA